MSQIVTVRDGVAPRGGRLTVDVADVGDRSTARLDLVLVEHAPDGLTERARRNEVVVASAPVESIGQPTVIPVPDDLPDPYTGVDISWDYQVVVARGRERAPDRARASVRIAGDASLADRHPAAGPALPIPPRVVTAPPASSADAIGWAAATAAMVGLLVVVGLATGSAFWFLVALAVGAFGLSTAWNRDRSHLVRVDGLSLTVDDRHLVRGVPFEVSIVGGAGQHLEVGLRGTEWNVDSEGERSSADVLEQWVPVTGEHVSFTIPLERPSTYGGGRIGVTWSVGVRPTRVLDLDARLAECRTTVHVRP